MAYNLRGKGLNADLVYQIEALVKEVGTLKAAPAISGEGGGLSTAQELAIQRIVVGLLGPFAQAPIGTTTNDPLLQNISSSANTVSSLTASTGITLTPNPIIATGTVAVADTAVTPGSYTYSSLTVDQQGRLTAAASGAAPTGTVTTTGTPANGNLPKFSGASSITNGDLSGDVTTSGTLATTIANLAVTNAKIANATIDLTAKVTGVLPVANGGVPQTAWTSYSPTWTNLTVGNGTVTAFYIQIGKTVFVRIDLVFGTTTSVSGIIAVTIPVTRVALGGIGGAAPLGLAGLYDQDVDTIYAGAVFAQSTTTVRFRSLSAGTWVNTSATVPFTWSAAGTDELHTEFFYEAA